MRYIISCLITWLLFSSHAQAEGLNQSALIEKFNQTFNASQTIKADFIQMMSDGTAMSGEFYMMRPDKMRITYAAPSKDFIVSDGKFVFYWDDALKQQSHTTLKSTIVGFLMKENFLDQSAIKVLSLTDKGAAYELTFTEPEYTDQGEIKLLFDKQTYELFQWEIQDFEGNWTSVKLEGVQKNLPLKKTLFYFKKPVS